MKSSLSIVARKYTVSVQCEREKSHLAFLLIETDGRREKEESFDIFSYTRFPHASCPTV